ncbi:MAG: hypothetical protein JO157_14610 [Acetobacteraceae bacterium]|nr:hypothetical protein [Acetobacteraceae bacterium]
MTCAALAIALVVAEGAKGVAGVLRGELPNPDSAMRLVRLRDMLAAGAPLETVARDGSGHGVVVQWSHLLDSLLLLLAAPLAPWLGWEEALQWVAPGFGPLCMGALGAALAWAVAPIAERRWRLFAPLLAATALPVAAYGVPGIVHHHVLLALVAVMAAGWAGRAAIGVAGAGRRVGAWGAAGLWLSPEAVPLTLMALAAIALACLARPGESRAAAELRRAGTSFMLLTAAAIAVDPPVADPFAPDIDRLSVMWLALAAACCAGGWLIEQAVRQGRPAYLAAVLGAAPVMAWLAAFPAVIRGTDAPLTPAEARAFLDVIAEFQPVHVADAAQFLSGGVLAIGLAGLLARRTRSLGWCWAASCALAILVLATQHLRFAAYSAALGAMALPVALTWCGDVLTRRREAALVIARPALLAAFLAGPTVGAAAASLVPEAGAASRIGCPQVPSAALLAQAAGQVVLASPGETPDLLYRTGVRTVGSLYHRGIASYMRARAAWRSSPANAEPPSVRATEARWVLVCRGAARDRLVADLPPETLQDRLERGEIPPWLQLAGADAAGWTLWRVLEPRV